MFVLRTEQQICYGGADEADVTPVPYPEKGSQQGRIREPDGPAEGLSEARCFEHVCCDLVQLKHCHLRFANSFAF